MSEDVLSFIRIPPSGRVVAARAPSEIAAQRVGWKSLGLVPLCGFLASTWLKGRNAKISNLPIHQLGRREQAVEIERGGISKALFLLRAAQFGDEIERWNNSPDDDLQGPHLELG